MADDPVTTDEARRAAQHESIKARVEGDVNRDIKVRAAVPAAGERAKLDDVATNLRGGAIHEVESRDREVNVARGLARGSGVIDYIFYVIYTLLAIRLVLVLISARSGNGFVQLIRNITDPFYGMFKGIVPNQTVEGGFTVAVPIVIAIVVYMLLHAAINGFLRMIAHRKTEI